MSLPRRSVTIRGSAVPTTVWSSAARNSPSSTPTTIWVRTRGSTLTGAAVAGVAVTAAPPRVAPSIEQRGDRHCSVTFDTSGRDNAPDGRVRSRGAAAAARAQDALRHPALPRRDAVPPRDDGLVAAHGAARTDRALPRSRDLRRRGAAGHRPPTAPGGPRGR